MRDEHQANATSEPSAPAPAGSGRRIVDYTGVSQYLGIPKATLRARVSRGDDIPYMRLGPRLVRFDLDEIDAWLTTKRGGAR